MRTLLILLLAGVSASVLASSSEAIRSVSWADSQHGWMSGCSLDDACVLSTENGGRTWHRIGSFEVEGLVRTSARGGLVFELGRPGPLRKWTLSLLADTEEHLPGQAVAAARTSTRSLPFLRVERWVSIA